MSILVKSTGFILLLLASWRCGGVPPTYFYRIDYEIDAEHASNNSVLPISIAVAPFKSDVLYESDKIVYRNSPYEVQFYNYRRWIVPPKKLITEQFFKHYRASGAFERVVRLPTSLGLDYILQGEIQAFEEWDEEAAWYGLVAVQLHLQKADTNEIVWEQVLTEKTTSESKSPVSVVKAISTSLNSVIEKSIFLLKEHLTRKAKN